MPNSTSSQSGKGKVYKNQNAIETLKSQKGSDFFDNFFDNFDRSQSYESASRNLIESKKPSSQQRQEFSIFNYQRYYEQEVVKKEIKELVDQIRSEIELIKKADSSLLQEVKDIQKTTLESLPEKPGIYHIRFFEIILSILRSLRAKIGESKTWLQAMVTKKKKRGSLFVFRAKKKGTLYSLSQELQLARSIQ